MTLQEKTRAMLVKEHMVTHGDNLLVAVSGGADSVGLLRVLKELEGKMGYHLYAMHVEHGLRGEQSLEDERFVKVLCTQWEIPCHTVSVPVQDYAAAHGCGTEEAARILRYESLERERRRIAEESGRRCRIAVAHHREDQAETVLFHLCRGSGLRGLRGMLPVNGEILRPFLEADRQEIREYLRTEGIGWREDATNAQDTYARNAIRHKVLPLLTEEINSQSIRHIGECAGELAQIQEYMEEQARQGLQSCVLQREILQEAKENICRENQATQLILSVERMLSYPPVLQNRIIYLALSETAGKMRDLQRVHIEAIRRLAEGEGNGCLSMPYGVTVRKSYDLLFFSAVNTEELYFSATNPEEKSPERTLQPEKSAKEGGGFSILRKEDYLWEVLPNPFPEGVVPQKKYTKWFDYDKIGLFLEFRTRQTGDRITVKEDGSSKKLSRLMIDSKVPAEIREQMTLPFAGSDVLWLPGVRINEAYRVRPTTKQVLKITLKSEAREYGGREDGRDHPRADQ